MKTAIVLVNYNGLRYLPDLFDSLCKLDYPSDQADIFFVDNASEDGSLEYARAKASNLQFKVNFIKNDKNLGFAGGNNTGVRQALKSANYKYIVLLNIDTVVDKNWLTELVKIAESDDEIGAAQSLILLHDTPELINTAGNMLHYLGFGWSGEYKQKCQMSNVKSNPKVKCQTPEIGYASGAAVLYRNDILQKIGLLDEQFFMYHEDLELSWRIRLAGYKIVLAPRSIIYHRYQFSRHKKKWYWTERNRLLVYFTMYKLRTIILFAPMFVFIEVGILVYSLIDGWFVWKLKSYWEVLASIPYIIKKRWQIAALRQVSDKQILAHMTSKLDFPEIKNPLIKFINPILAGYFKLIYR